VKLVLFTLNQGNRKRIMINPEHVAAVYEYNDNYTDIHFSAETTDTDGSGGMAWFQVVGGFAETVERLTAE